MKNSVPFLAMLTLVSLALGQQAQQQPYQPAVPAPSVNSYGGGNGYYGGGGNTAAGSAMNGMSNVISASGDAALSRSAAAVNMTEAQSREIENHQQYTDAYFDMRATNKAARDAERGPRPTAEQLARLAHERVPKKLSPGEVNEVTGKLNWPSALTLDMFAADRKQIEGLFISYSQLGTLNYASKAKAREIINSMNKKLKAQVRTLPTPDYVACKSFLRSLLYTTCKSQLS